MREVTTHQIADLPNEFAPDLRVFAWPGDKFGIPHRYSLCEEPLQGDSEIGPDSVVSLRFQSGDPRQGWNGGTTLAYLAAILDFLTQCQASQFGCPENVVAIELIGEAMRQLQLRIQRRAAEGTFQTHQGDPPKPPAAPPFDPACPDCKGTGSVETQQGNCTSYSPCPMCQAVGRKP